MHEHTTAMFLLAFTLASSEAGAQRGTPGQRSQAAADTRPTASPAVAAAKPSRPAARVRVSRQEMQAEFHTDTTGRWGWSDRTDPQYMPQYTWTIGVSGMDGPYTLNLWVMRNTEGARDFPSLAAVVSSSVTTLCGPIPIPDCKLARTTATVRGDAVVLALRDSASIARLFGMRPTSVRASEIRPGPVRWWDSVRVEYVEPQIAEPDSVTRADSARSRRRYEARINSIHRFIGSSDRHGKDLWIVVGDSIPVSVHESHCRYDVCYIADWPILPDSGWTVADRSVARLQHVAPKSKDHPYDLDAYGFRWFLKGLRPGRTTVSVRGIRGPSDTAVSREPPARALRRDVVVTPPIGRIEITPRPDTVIAGRPFVLRARVLDTNGQPITDAPVTFREPSVGNIGSSSSYPTEFAIRTSGRTQIVAEVRGRTDTLTVTVIDSVSPAPRR
jgi:hypothetical protein